LKFNLTVNTATVLYDEYNMVASTLFLILHTSFACYRRVSTDTNDVLGWSLWTVCKPVHGWNDSLA